jgi:hypothetical protein
MARIEAQASDSLIELQHASADFLSGPNFLLRGGLRSTVEIQ